MLHVPFGLVLAAVPTAAVVEIDCSTIPPPGGVAFDYKIGLTLGFANGESETVPFLVSREATPDDVASAIHGAISGGKWASRQVGLSVFIYRYDGSPVTKAVVEGDGPKPEVRWWPLPRPTRKAK